MPLYTAQKHSKIVKKVMLNGVDVTNLCLEADTDEKYVKFFVRNKTGGIVTCMGGALTAISCGKVEVILHDLPQQLIDAGGVLED